MHTAHHTDGQAYENLLNASFFSHGAHLDLIEPEFMRYFCSFAHDTVNDVIDLTPAERSFYGLATTLGLGTLETYKTLLEMAIIHGVDATKIVELVYQSIGAAGFSRTYPFMLATHRALERFGMAEPRNTDWNTPDGLRRTDGERIARILHGDQAENICMRRNPHYPWLTDWITTDLYGTYYARGGLSLYERETAMFCMICALGADEGPLEIDMRACVNVGATPAKLMEITASNLPLLGYIRCTRVLTAIERMAETL